MLYFDPNLHSRLKEKKKKKLGLCLGKYTYISRFNCKCGTARNSPLQLWLIFLPKDCHILLTVTLLQLFFPFDVEGCGERLSEYFKLLFFLTVTSSKNWNRNVLPVYSEHILKCASFFSFHSLPQPSCHF